MWTNCVSVTPYVNIDLGKLYHMSRANKLKLAVTTDKDLFYDVLWNDQFSTRYDIGLIAYKVYLILCQLKSNGGFDSVISPTLESW